MSKNIPSRRFLMATAHDKIERAEINRWVGRGNDNEVKYVRENDPRSEMITFFTVFFAAHAVAFAAYAIATNLI